MPTYAIISAGFHNRYNHPNPETISRIENHAEDIKLSTLHKVALALGRHLKVSLV